VGSDPSWRASNPVLVAEAQTLGAIAVIRSLGRAGYPVHACSWQADALGLSSNKAVASVVCPSYDQPEFLTWLRDQVAVRGIRAIIPSEGMLLALRPAFKEFSSLLPFCPDECTLYAGMSKCDVFKSLTHPVDGAEGAGEHLPPSLLVEAGGPVPTVVELRELGLPLYLKVDACYGRDGGKVHKAASPEEALDRLVELIGRAEKVLVQGHVPGQGVGAFFLFWQGQVVAEFMHRRLHEVPYEGGVSSLRESCFVQAIRDDALAKLRCLGWEGVAMMEYRHDQQTGRFAFLELNGRFWGSLHLALFAGVDFPTLLVDAFFGRPAPLPAPKPVLGIRCRNTFPGEVQYVWSRLKGSGLSRMARAWSVVEFFLLTCNPAIHSDLLFPGDRKLYWKNFWRFGGTLLRALGRRVGKRSRVEKDP
jgi:hypothetical protein